MTNTNYTNNEIATNFNLFQEYVDVNAEMTEAQFDAMTVEAREALIESCFGTDEQQAEQNA